MDTQTNIVTIILNRSNVRTLLENELKIAYKFDWTGWRIPIYLDGVDDIDDGNRIECDLSSGGWLSNNSWQPDAIEVCKIETWELNYDLSEDADEDEEIYYSIEDMLDNYDYEEEIEQNILEHFNNKFEPNFEVIVEWI